MTAHAAVNSAMEKFCLIRAGVLLFLLPWAAWSADQPAPAGCQTGKNGFTTCDCAANVDPVLMEGEWGAGRWSSGTRYAIRISDVSMDDASPQPADQQKFRATVVLGAGDPQGPAGRTVEMSKCYPHRFVISDPPRREVYEFHCSYMTRTFTNTKESITQVLQPIKVTRPCPPSMDNG